MYMSIGSVCSKEGEKGGGREGERERERRKEGERGRRQGREGGETEEGGRKEVSGALAKNAGV